MPKGKRQKRQLLKGNRQRPVAAPARRHPNAPRAGAAACTWCARWPDVPVTSPRWRGGLLQAAALAREHVGCRRAGARLRVGGRAGARAVLRWPRWPGRGKMVKTGNFTERAPRPNLLSQFSSKKKRSASDLRVRRVAFCRPRQALPTSRTSCPVTPRTRFCPRCACCRPVLRLFPPRALVSHAQGSSGVVDNMPFAWRGHTKSLTTRARPSPDLAVWLE